MRFADFSNPLPFVLAVLIGSSGIVLSSSAHAFFINPYDPLTESFTYVVVQDNFFGTGVDRIGEANLEASTSFAGSLVVSIPVGDFAGQVDGTGHARFGRLGARVDATEGSGLQSGWTTAGFNEVFTVLPPLGVAAGTPGMMSLNYFLDGETIIDYDAEALGDDRANGTVNPFAPDLLGRARLTIWQRTGPGADMFVSDVRELMRLDDLPTGSASTGGPHNAVLSHSVASLDVLFNYGEPFAVTTELRVEAYIESGAGTAYAPYVNHITVDFLNTARLVAIINEAHPDAEVVGLGGSYNHLVTDTLPPVPLPPAVWLLGSALLLASRCGVMCRLERDPVRSRTGNRVTAAAVAMAFSMPGPRRPSISNGTAGSTTAGSNPSTGIRSARRSAAAVSQPTSTGQLSPRRPMTRCASTATPRQ